ncbi:type II toxin-antitoxin system HicA family toxin [uncultured Alsobacter sp.]|uniref:type II toxin-antitoxin system HicA family toxin n=1 Tax=uncultured Alsobacter sp. TaxID=1748258 RepID=UPI00345D560D
MARLVEEGWVLLRSKGSHHHFGKAGERFIVTVPHPKRDLPLGTVKAIYRQAGWA